MDRKLYIQKFVSDMEEKYKPSDRMRDAMRVQLCGLLDSRITDDAFYSLIKLVEETYQRGSDIKANCDSARRSLTQISSDLTETIERLGQAVDEYGKATTTVMQTYASMADTLNDAGKVIAAQGQTIRQLTEDRGKLEDKALEAHLRENPPQVKA